MPHLRPRTNTFSAAFRVRSAAAAIHRFFQEQGFVYVHTPIFTGPDCEGAGEMFRVTTLDLNNVPPKPRTARETSARTSSSQHPAHRFRPAGGGGHGLAFGKGVTFGPTFRAEEYTPPPCRGVLDD